MKFPLPGPWPDAGNFILRLGVGIAVTVHGWPMISGGAAAWERIGAAIAGAAGIHFWPVFWGFLFALSQTVGGALIAAGFLARPAALVLAILMGLAAVAVFHFSGGNFKEWSVPAEAALTCLAIAVMGTGRFAISGN